MQQATHCGANTSAQKKYTLVVLMQITVIAFTPLELGYGC